MPDSESRNPSRLGGNPGAFPRESGGWRRRSASGYGGPRSLRSPAYGDLSRGDRDRRSPSKRLPAYLDLPTEGSVWFQQVFIAADFQPSPYNCVDGMQQTRRTRMGAAATVLKRRLAEENFALGKSGTPRDKRTFCCGQG